MTNRTRLYTLLNVGRTRLGWDDELYRAVLSQYGAKEKDGKVSATTMTLGQLEQMLTHMKKCGFKPRAKAGSASNISDWRAPRIKKISALWIALAEAGVVDHREESAMVRWCAATAGCKRLQWANSQQLNQCVEGLKSWAKREGVKLNE